MDKSFLKRRLLLQLKLLRESIVSPILVSEAVPTYLLTVHSDAP